MSSASETIAPPPAERANGLATYLKVFYAPSEAFATLARVPTWGWAAIIGVILTLVSTLILMPATLHYTQSRKNNRSRRCLRIRPHRRARRWRRSLRWSM